MDVRKKVLKRQIKHSYWILTSDTSHEEKNRFFFFRKKGILFIQSHNKEMIQSSAHCNFIDLWSSWSYEWHINIQKICVRRIHFFADILTFNVVKGVANLCDLYNCLTTYSARWVVLIASIFIVSFEFKSLDIIILHAYSSQYVALKRPLGEQKSVSKLHSLFNSSIF